MIKYKSLYRIPLFVEVGDRAPYVTLDPNHTKVFTSENGSNQLFSRMLALNVHTILWQVFTKVFVTLNAKHDVNVDVQKKVNVNIEEHANVVYEHPVGIRMLYKKEQVYNFFDHGTYVDK